ncbi:uncharacterized protein LOC134762243 [Penaeus indicus]|uniref:uncharacterized protein LOC134762243 n=1 Tax=Penaeus indicus TaxID=29960 RepID=UPI00300DB24F
MAQGSYKWIMVYQDHITKFCVLHPPSSKRAAEVAHHLTDILLLFGAPYILQSDNGSEFAAKVISELKIIWSKLVLNQSAKDPWKEQTKNSSLHAGICRSPYAAMFGCEAKVGMVSSSLPDERGHHPSVDPNHPVPCRFLTAEVDIDAERGCHQSIVSSTQREINPAVSRAVTLVNPGASPENNLSRRENNIIAQRKGAHMSQLAQAERMVKWSRIDLAAGEPLDNAAVLIPLVDRGRGDPQNILGVVLEQNDMYTTGVKAGVLKAKLSSNQFDLCTHRLLGQDSMNHDRVVSLREAIIFESNCGGQGFVKCNCTGPKTDASALKTKLNVIAGATPA